MSLKEYAQKRDFALTEEPEPKKEKSGKRLRFVVQKHQATSLHYDFRLEWDGVLLSWAVPKGPSFNPSEKRLAIRVEDHPFAYKDFEGTIPEGEYGGGMVMLWDEGTWTPEGDGKELLTGGSLKFTLDGERLKGGWALVHMKPKPGEEDKNWLLIKENDEHAKATTGISAFTKSVRSGLTMKQIADKAAKD